MSMSSPKRSLMRGPQAQEVHLQHAHVLDVVAVVLRDAHVLARFLVLGYGNGQEVGQVTAADDGCAGVDAHLPDAAFQGLGVPEDFLVDLRPVLELVDEFRHQPEAVLERDLDVDVLHAALEHLLDQDLLPLVLGVVHFDFLLDLLEPGPERVQLGVERIFPLLLLAEPVRHHLRQAVRLVQREVADARHVLDGALGRHGPEGNDP